MRYSISKRTVVRLSLAVTAEPDKESVMDLIFPKVLADGLVSESI
jgi:hypothetical protein